MEKEGIDPKLIPDWAKLKPEDPGYDRYLARLNWKLYVKHNPDLKRHYPENWGRDLDNHYDP